VSLRPRPVPPVPNDAARVARAACPGGNSYLRMRDEAAVRALNRLELVRQALRNALDDLAVAAPDWLRDRADPEWAKRFQRRSDEHRLPKGKQAQRELAEVIGAGRGGPAPGVNPELPADRSGPAVAIR
jgi:hypothetical protein